MNRHKDHPARQQIKELMMDFYHKASGMHDHLYQMRRGEGDHQMDQEELNVYYVDMIYILKNTIEAIVDLYDQQNKEQQKEQQNEQ